MFYPFDESVWPFLGVRCTCLSWEDPVYTFLILSLHLTTLGFIYFARKLLDH